ncbi:MAG: hypothetical protein AB7O21_14875 [Gammaproteobacteria bacterium]
MIRKLVVVNVLLTLPFGIAALLAPQPIFAQFGVALDADGALVARGYAATLIGFGLVLWGLRDSRDPAVVTPLLVGLLLFNAIEAGVQAAAATAGVATGAIGMNVALHAGVAAWLLGALAARRHTAGASR